MGGTDLLAEDFERHRARLRAVAYRMLGTFAEADDAVQETWLRVSRAGTDGVGNLGGWLTTVVARVSLNMLRTRRSRSEDPLDARVPEPVVALVPAADPEGAAVLADSVGLALHVVLETLGPAERLAFVLHDVFGLPFEEIAPVVERTPAAARQLASRARRRVRGAATPVPPADLGRARRVVDAFLAAARDGDLEALVAALHPDAVLRWDGGARPGASAVVRGAAPVARQARRFHRPDATLRPALVDGRAGVVATVGGRPFAVVGFTVVRERITAIDALADADRLARLARRDPALFAARTEDT